MVIRNLAISIVFHHRTFPKENRSRLHTGDRSSWSENLEFFSFKFLLFGFKFKSIYQLDETNEIKEIKNPIKDSKQGISNGKLKSYDFINSSPNDSSFCLSALSKRVEEGQREKNRQEGRNLPNLDSWSNWKSSSWIPGSQTRSVMRNSSHEFLSFRISIQAYLWNGRAKFGTYSRC